MLKNSRRKIYWLELSTEGFLGIRNMMELLLSAIIEL
jgi:hypothetical protein